MAIATITGIHGVPRSGTSWLAQLFNASPQVALKFQPLFSYAFKEAVNAQSSPKDITGFFNAIYRSEDTFLNMRDPEIHKDYPEFSKQDEPAHLVFKQVRYHHLLPHLMRNNTQLKMIFVLRNPLAVLASWKRAPKEFNPAWDFEQQWQLAALKNQDRPHEFFGYQRWKDAAAIFLELHALYPERTALVYYKDLLANTQKEVQRLYSFAQIPFDSAVSEFITTSKSRTGSDPNSVFRAKTTDDAWKEVIPFSIASAIKEDLKNHPLNILL